MIFIWGSRLYGKVDDANGVFHVATKFAHLWFIPLFPVGSSVAIVERTGDSYRGAPIGLSGKSVLAAYLRGWTIPAIGLLGLIGLVNLSPGRNGPNVIAGVVFLLLAAGTLALCIWSYASARLNRAPYERAAEIAEKLGMSDPGRVLLQLAYERITPQEAEAAIAEIRAHQEELARLAPASAAAPAPPPALRPPPLPVAAASPRKA